MFIRFFKNECNVANTILQSRDRFNVALLQCNIINQIVISQPKSSECHCFTALVEYWLQKLQHYCTIFTMFEKGTETCN